MIRGTFRTTRNQRVRPSFPQKTAWQIPNSTRCCSESIGYVRKSCFIVGQRATVREHLCNYCATKISTVYPADGRPSRPLTMERLADLRSSDVPPGSGQTNQYNGVSQH